MIVDACTFFNEVDLLEMRFCQLDPVVDFFVVVEADRTHAGAEKPSYLPPELVRRWRHKLHVHTAHLPKNEPGDLLWTWRREIAQRNAILDALRALRLASDDMILISDCDEIPRHQFIQHLPWLPHDAIAVAGMRLSYYTVNHVSDATWLGTRATQYANVEALGADGVRYAGRERGGFPRIMPLANMGWHLSYFGGAQAVQSKIESFLHQEFNSAENRDTETIARRIAQGDDVYGRSEQVFVIAHASDLPDAMYERPMRWARHFHPDYAPCFHEDWMSGDQTTVISQIAMRAPDAGACVEIGCWEGNSTIAIAHALGNRTLIAVDTWQGNADEDEEHPTVSAAQGRDVFAQFQHNVDAYGLTNVFPHRMDWRAWNVPDPIAFVHLDASHDAETVSDQLDALFPKLITGGILCGDDWHAPGVRLALTRLPGQVTSDGKLWWWQKE